MTQFRSNAQARRNRALWMATVETHVLRVAPARAGRIDWIAATFFFDQGFNPGDAASRLIDAASAPALPAKDGEFDEHFDEIG